ncbi:alpha/beta hydrolase [Novosphingobium flavum]|uniref:alpha/beta hydrolase n=1 Tax=Novosphingobium aerophilum TaxID=2839843 RepID=UPI001639BC96|nr:alpha/beta hydrolase [Novosphingobium aerophilum]MBC2661940.1 alpha/beta hydrolase [Novosphingobium aerophilum]
MFRLLRHAFAVLALSLLTGPLAAQPMLVAAPVAREELGLPPAAADAGRVDLGRADVGGADGAGQRREVARVGGDDAAAGSGRFVAAHPLPVAAGREVLPPLPIPQGIARFGPFRVLDGQRAALVDATDERSPAAFQAMLARFPGIRTLELIECPGTEEDRANLRLGRMIRARGLETYVPPGGSVRSGGVELYLAGVRRRADPGAEFAVHAWADDAGREPQDFPRNAPQNRAYILYYREMGMTPQQARAFYDMTNSVPNASALWLTAEQMAAWVQPG